MKLPKKFTILLLFLFLIASRLSLNTVYAQIPEFYGSCDEELDEYHSLRPYRAKPSCNPDVSEEKLYCGNDLIVKKTFKVTLPADTLNCDRHPDGSLTCPFEFSGSTRVSVDLVDAELPIMGNTQLVTNSQEQAEVLDDAEKVNEYVSWYLNGVNNRAEYKFLNIDSPEEISKLVNFSGPLNKLLPWEVQMRARLDTVDQAGDTRHNQLVACTVLGVPVPCYHEGILNLIDGEHRLSDWKKEARRPPLPSDEEFLGKDFAAYWKEYLRWRGKWCSPDFEIPIIGKKIYLCFDDPTKPNYWANLFPYIPLSSTEDRTGEVVAPEFEPGTDYAPIQPQGDVAVSGVSFDPDNDRDDIFFAHMEESSKLAALLQKTYKAKDIRGFSGATGANEDFYKKSDHCDLADVRWNSGDDLLGEVHREGYDEISGTLSYTASFSCHFSPTESEQECKKDAYIAMAVYTRTPKANEAWDRLVAGGQSIFKRLYPGAMLEEAEIKDYPAVTTAKYETTGSDEILAGNPSNKRSGERAEIFVPHVGGIQEYFLKGIQKALRPQGFAN